MNYKKKIQPCIDFLKKGSCKRGKECSYIHIKITNIRRKELNYKITLCKNYHSYPFICPFKDECNYVHYEPEFFPTAVGYKQLYRTSRLPVFYFLLKKSKIKGF